MHQFVGAVIGAGADGATGGLFPCMRQFGDQAHESRGPPPHLRTPTNSCQVQLDAPERTRVDDHVLILEPTPLPEIDEPVPQHAGLPHHARHQEENDHGHEAESHVPLIPEVVDRVRARDTVEEHVRPGSKQEARQWRRYPHPFASRAESDGDSESGHHRENRVSKGCVDAPEHDQLEHRLFWITDLDVVVREYDHSRVVDDVLHEGEADRGQPGQGDDADPRDEAIPVKDDQQEQDGCLRGLLNERGDEDRGSRTRVRCGAGGLHHLPRPRVDVDARPRRGARPPPEGQEPDEWFLGPEPVEPDEQDRVHQGRPHRPVRRHPQGFVVQPKGHGSVGIGAVRAQHLVLVHQVVGEERDQNEGDPEQRAAQNALPPRTMGGGGKAREPALPIYNLSHDDLQGTWRPRQDSNLRTTD